MNLECRGIKNNKIIANNPRKNYKRKISFKILPQIFGVRNPWALLKLWKIVLVFLSSVTTTWNDLAWVNIYDAIVGVWFMKVFDSEIRF